jgi:zinc finger protein
LVRVLTNLLKSETSSLKIPEIDLELQAGTLGGRFTTVEGILEQVYEELSEKVFTAGDSSATGEDDRIAYDTFLTRLKEVNEPRSPLVHQLAYFPFE